jgi:hypothetical protein
MVASLESPVGLTAKIGETIAKTQHKKSERKF